MTTTTAIILIICLANMIIAISSFIAESKNRKIQKYIHLCDDIFNYLKDSHSCESFEVGCFTSRNGNIINFCSEIKKDGGRREIPLKKLTIVYSTEHKKGKKEIKVYLIKNKILAADQMNKYMLYYREIKLIE